MLFLGFALSESIFDGDALFATFISSNPSQVHAA